MVAPQGSDTNSCSASSPCASLNRAYHVAKPGQTVQVVAGSYGSQAITSDATKASGPDVVFQPSGAVSLGGLSIAGSHVALQNMTTKGWTVKYPADHVTLQSVTATAGVYITGASNVSVLGGSAGPSPGQYVTNGSQITGGTARPTNLLFDGVTFHDFRKAPGSSNHVDCLHVMSGSGITIRNSTFYNCEHFAVLFTVYGSFGSPSNVLVDNNSLGCCASGYYSLMLGGGHGEVFNNFLISNNRGGPAPMATGTVNVLNNVVFRNNPIGVAGCNRLTPSTCS